MILKNNILLNLTVDIWLIFWYNSRRSLEGGGL